MMNRTEADERAHVKKTGPGRERGSGEGRMEEESLRKEFEWGRYIKTYVVMRGASSTSVDTKILWPLCYINRRHVWGRSTEGGQNRRDGCI